MSGILFRIVEYFDVRLVSAKNLLSSLQRVPGRNVRVAGHEQVQVALSLFPIATFLQDLKDP